MSIQQIAARLHLPIARRDVDRRKSFRIDPDFQNRFRLRILALALAISLLCVLVTLAAAAATMLPGLAEHRTLLQLAILSLALGEGFLIIYACDRFSHRYCGAVYRIQKTLEAVHRGERVDPIRIRSGDEFVELADQLNATLVELGAMNGPVDSPRTTAPSGEA